MGQGADSRPRHRARPPGGARLRNVAAGVLKRSRTRAKREVPVAGRVTGKRRRVRASPISDEGSTDIGVRLVRWRRAGREGGGGSRILDAVPHRDPAAPWCPKFPVARASKTTDNGSIRYAQAADDASAGFPADGVGEPVARFRVHDVLSSRFPPLPSGTDQHPTAIGRNPEPKIRQRFVAYCRFPSVRPPARRCLPDLGVARRSGGGQEGSRWISDSTERARLMAT